MKTSIASFTAAFLALVCLAGCQGLSSGDRNATATSQSLRAQTLATRMAGMAQTTKVAQLVNQAATLEALEGMQATGQQWPVVLAETFDDNRLEWPLGESLESLGDAAWEMPAGKLRWSLTAKDSMVWWAIPTMGALEDFYLSATVNQLEGPDSAEHGLVFRLDSDAASYYLFEINGQGQYAVYLHEGDQWLALDGWTDSPAVRSGENHLAVFAQGPQLLFFVNHEMVANHVDFTLEGGKSGLLVGLSAAGDRAVWEFDDFELRSLETPVPDSTQTPPP